MKINLKRPPRVFSAGSVDISDCGSISLEPDEQVTFVTTEGREYDVCRKEWGYYATPSINGRLREFGYRTALVQNPLGSRYIMLVDQDKQDIFHTYLAEQGSSVETWLDKKD